MWGWTLVAEVLVVEVLCLGWIFVPPHAHGGTVVTRYGADAEPGIAVEYAPTDAGILGHGDEFEREYLQLVHDPGYAVGNHAEVFGADEHFGGIAEHGKFLHGFFVPELVVAAIEVVIVQTVEVVFVVLPKGLVDGGLLHGYAWVVEIGVLVIAEEEYVAYEGIQA